MKITTLEHVTIEEILSVFNEAFSDYVIPFKMTIEQLNSKIKSENIQLQYSLGTYVNDKLVGFILHATEDRGDSIQLYNAGTGVIPSQRGQKITQKMYQFGIPVYKEREVSSIILEVISGNDAAIRSYENMGFRKTRDLNCYSGHINEKTKNDTLQIREIPKSCIEDLKAFADIRPSWQNSFETIKRMGEMALLVGLFDQESLIGYLALNKSNHRIIQVAIEPKERNKGSASTLFQYIRDTYSEKTSIINVDVNSKNLNECLVAIGLSKSIMQHEMLLSF